MCRGLFAAMTIAAFMAGGMPLEAQTRIKAPQTIQVQPKIKAQPRINKPPVMAVKPIIPPSLAAKNIMRVMPQAKVLKMVSLPTGDIVATIRLQNQVRKVRVNGKTGAVQQ